MSEYKEDDLVLHIAEDLIGEVEINLLRIIHTCNEYGVVVVKEVIGDDEESVYSIGVDAIYPAQELDEHQEDILTLEKEEHQARVARIKQRVADIKEVLK